MKAALLALPLLAGTAHAEPAGCDEDSQYELATYPEYVTFCVACGDRAPSEPAHADAHTWVTAKMETTYVRVSPDRYENLAERSGCAAPGQPHSLHVSTATDHGVLITPDWAAVQAPPAPAPRPEPLIVAAPQIIFVPVDDGPPWALLGGIVGLAIGATGVLLAVALPRRRRSSLPRALHLGERLDR